MRAGADTALRAALACGCVLGWPVGTQAADAASYDACRARVEHSDERRSTEAAGGRLAVNELFIERCGFRPTARSPARRAQLADKDCRIIYAWARQQVCRPEDLANVQSEIVKQLDPKVFDLSRYTSACQRVAQSASAAPYAEFREGACVAPATPRSKRGAASRPR